MSTFENFRVDPLTGKLTMTAPVTGGTELPTSNKAPSVTALSSPTNTTHTIVVTDGPSIVAADIDVGGHLIITYSDATTDDLGVVTADAGADGRTILNGTISPLGGVGANGDFYIRTTDSTIYGPKASGTWPAPVSLVGMAGNTVLSAAGAPSGGLGANGDFYIDTAADAIYGPKAAGVWGSATPLIGPAAADGIDGIDGIDGKTILSGAGAPSGGLGTNGDFYIDTTASAIYGPKGTPSPGWNTGTAIVGAAGAAGSAGADGSNGRTILSGTGVPSGGLGADGDFYIDTAADAIYGPKTTGAWGSATSLIGAAGAAGADGADGIVPAYNTLASVKAIDHTTLTGGDVIAMLGSATLGDGLGGLFFWNAVSTATADDVLVITPTSNSGAGRLLAVRDHFSPTAGTIGAAATDLATATTLVNELRTIMINNGFGS